VLPGLVVAAAGGGSFVRPSADAVMERRVSSCASPDISGGMPIVTTGAQPNLALQDREGRHR
jgi:hypothetical protein